MPLHTSGREALATEVDRDARSAVAPPSCWRVKTRRSYQSSVTNASVS